METYSTENYQNAHRDNLFNVIPWNSSKRLDIDICLVHESWLQMFTFNNVTLQFLLN